MAVTKVLARDWDFEIDNTGYVQINGINSFSLSRGKSDADITDFDSNGWEEHLVVSRNASITLEGLFMEVPRRNNLPTVYATVTAAPTLGAGDVTVTLTPSGGAAEDFVVALLGTDTAAQAAVKIAAEIDADLAWTAWAEGAIVIINNVAGTRFTFAFVDTDTTGCAMATVYTSGERDPGQQLVDDLAEEHDEDAIGLFRVTSPGGTTYVFNASVELADVGGGNNDPTKWGATLTVDGEITVT